MNRKHILGVFAGSLALSTAAFADHGYGRGGDFDQGYNDGADSGYDWAQVVSVDPLVRQVRVTVPRRECVNETRYVPVRGAYGRPGQGAAGQMILGGLIGAVIGHQMDGRHSRNNGTLAGGVIGAAIGHDIAERNAGARGAYGGDRGGYGSDEVRPVSVERCEVHEDEHFEDRTEGYRVTYRYNGRTYVTRTAADPGRQIRVRVAVSPAD
jgi:uncharacterized protein YcfJ